MLFLQILGSILFIFVLFANIFMIIRAFLRGYADWAWGLIVIFIALISTMFLVTENIEFGFLRSLLILIWLGLSSFPPIIVFRIAKLPDMPPLPCKGCGEEVTTKRKVTVNLDNNEVVPARSTTLVLLITGGALIVLGIWLFIFALGNDRSVAGPGILAMFGFSLIGTNLRELLNKPKNLGLGYFYKCKKCEEKWVHVPENS